MLNWSNPLRGLRRWIPVRVILVFPAAKKVKLPRSRVPKPSKVMRDRRVRKATRSGVKIKLKREME